MAYGGGIYISQNKKLPGTYINFIGKRKSSGALSDRGTAAVALSLGWGELGKIVKVSRSEISKKCLKLFGVPYTDPSMMPIRELFCNANDLLVYRLGTGGERASNTYAEAKCVGTLGNKIITLIAATTNGETATGWNVKTYLGGEVVDEQNVKGSNLTTAALEENDFVKWKSNVTLAGTTKTTGAMTGGTDPEAVNSHGAFLSLLQSYPFQVVACSSTTPTIIAEYVAFVKDMRDNCGAKCQAVVYKSSANFEGVINAVNPINGETSESGDIVYWLAGAEAACAVNKSCTNMTYNGELDVYADYDNGQLENALDAGQAIFHRVGDEIRLLEDINSLTSFDETKTEDFRYNQTIRVLDQIANDVTSLYNNRYIGKVPNDDSGRVSLWSDIVSMCNALLNLRAIENFSSEDVEVLPGEAKNAVVANLVVTPVNAMSKLYMSVYVY